MQRISNLPRRIPGGNLLVNQCMSFQEPFVHIYVKNSLGTFPWGFRRIFLKWIPAVVLWMNSKWKGSPIKGSSFIIISRNIDCRINHMAFPAGTLRRTSGRNLRNNRWNCLPGEHLFEWTQRRNSRKNLGKVPEEIRQVIPGSIFTMNFSLQLLEEFLEEPYEVISRNPLRGYSSLYLSGCFVDWRFFSKQ